MRNTSGEIIRFEWPFIEEFHFEPRVGHIPKGGLKDISITLSSEKSASFEGEKLLCETIQIEYENSQIPVNWDDRVKTVQWKNIYDENIGRWVKKKVYEAHPEPENQPTAGSRPEKFAISVYAVVDSARAEIDIENIIFDDQEIFTRETEIFKLKNTGKIGLQFQWDLVSGGISRPVTANRSFVKTALPYSPTDPVFTIVPDSGYLASGEEITVEVTFQPRNVSDYEFIAACRIPNFDTSISQIQVPLVGQGLVKSIMQKFSKEYYNNLLRQKLMISYFYKIRTLLSMLMIHASKLIFQLKS